MKKFIVSLVILIIAGAAVFYFGWVQYQLPADTYGVAFTKTNGWDDHVLAPGKFDWRWQRLLPTNFKLYRFRIAPRQVDVTSTGTLPSADLYSRYLEGAPSFKFDMEILISYRLKAEALPGLAKSGTTSQSGLDAWYRSFDTSVTAEAADELTAALSDLTQGSRPAQFDASALGRRLLDGLSRKYPDIIFDSAVPKKFSVPDVDLYQKARQMYFSVLDSKKASIQNAVDAAARQQVDKSNQLDLLRQYGELLTQYPVLLKYLALEQGKSLNSVDLSDIQVPPAPSSSGAGQ